VPQKITSVLQKADTGENVR